MGIWKVNINAETYSLEKRTTHLKEELYIDNVISEKVDIQKINPYLFHILLKDNSFNIRILKQDKIAKTFEVMINTKIVTIALKDSTDLLLERLNLQNCSSINTDKTLKAPMPGLVLEIAVKAGDKVIKGQKLIILEAMKMENVLEASKEGIIKIIHIEKNTNVEKNAELITFA